MHEFEHICVDADVEYVVARERVATALLLERLLR